MTRLRQLLALSLGFLLFNLVALAQTSPATSKPAAAANPSFVVKVTGKGTPMILIPGFSSSGDTWNATVEHFKDRYECHVITLAGFAGTAPTEPPLLAKVEEDLADYIEKKHLRRPIIVGHSLGGNVAMDLAERHPDLTGPLVIVDSLPFFAGAWFQVNSVKDAAPMLNQMHTMMQSQTHEQYETFVRSGVTVKYMATSPEDVKTLIAWGLNSDQKTVTETMYEMLNTDLRSDLSKITAPSLVLGTWAGIHDQMKDNGGNITAEQIERTFEKQYSGLHNLHFALAPTARHFIMWDDPKWFYQQVESFLANPVEMVQNPGFSVKQ